MDQNITPGCTLKEMEQTLWRVMQKTYAQVMEQQLLEYDEALAAARDKNRYRLKEKRRLTLDTLFGSIEIMRNYYKDRQTGDYVYLLDQYLQCEELKGYSPMVEELAVELAVTSTSYNQAAETLKSLLGYKVMSHETIRQHILQLEVLAKEKQDIFGDVLFVEVDGLYIKRQDKNKRGREEKIASVHQGWEVNGKRVSLVNKRHFHHRDKKPFWESFEQFLIDTYNYDPTRHRIVINGDGANWIKTGHEYFGRKSYYIIDRFHVARDIQRIFRDHNRCKNVKKALATYDAEALLLELNSAVGTLGNEKKEEKLEALLKQLTAHPDGLKDYREWLKQHNINTTQMRTMGSAEATMSTFAKRLKHGRSWVEKGIQAMIQTMIAYKDKMDLRTIAGKLRMVTEDPVKEEPVKEKAAKYYKEKLTNTAGEMTRNNLAYLKQGSGSPMFKALSALRGI